MEHTLTQLCDIDPMLDDIKISLLVFHPYLPLQIRDIKSIKVDPMLYDIKVLARCISIWRAHPSGNPNNICSLDIVFQDHQNSYSDIETEDGGQEVIWFDVNKEEFWLIERPKSMCDKWTYFLRNKLVDLNGEVGYVTETMEVWILSHKKEWVPHCQFKDIVLDRVIIDVSGCWNKDRDILIRSIYGNPVGFDAFTNTYKMVCVLLKEYTPPNKPDMVKKNLCTMVHVFGTNSWREIPQVPSYPITGKAVFANACLHWFVSHLDIKTEDGGREVIWFDINKEEFRLIDSPKRMFDLWSRYICYYNHLVDLNGEVGYVCCRTMEVCVLNKCWPFVTDL
uniref:F-box domain-containing protein n=1 Tax=Tanacetum cinerariifolium TaxID=118510 RepID=A0A699GI08_TANCI|nr:F-box domain-containing protein [Tanacetum cinerariifolium]